jgi:hypothetical protein
MMKSYCDLIRTKVLIAGITFFLMVSSMGCIDPQVTDMEAEHIRLSNEAKQELQQCPTFPPISQTEALFTAP